MLVRQQDDDDVFVRWHLTGTHAGPMFSVAATGRPIAVDGVDHFVLLDGARSTRRRAWPTTSSLRAADMAESPTHPNVVLIITDQERAPIHWPQGFVVERLVSRS